MIYQVDRAAGRIITVWTVSAVTSDGAATVRLDTCRSRRAAVRLARLLAGRTGRVTVNA
jgi:hypothetical protein